VLAIPFQRHEVEDYERKRYRGLDQRIVDWRERRILKKILHRVKVKTPMALDIPCGYGRFSGLLLSHSFFLISSDLSFHMVERALEKKSTSDNICGVVADAEAGLPFQSRIFSLLLSMRFFHHIHESKSRGAILRELHRVASDWVIVSFYQKNILHFLQRKFRKKMRGKKRDIKMNVRDEFQKQAELAGFDVIEIFPLFRGIHAQHVALLRKN
jgi:SAM-dependent methyltransferase